MKRVFGIFEAAFDIIYLLMALIVGIILILTSFDNYPRMLAGIMALVLVVGDSFHLVPRMVVIFTKNEERMRKALGSGKLITSITMTVFYILLWEVGRLLFSLNQDTPWRYIEYMVYFLAAARIFLCFLPQNRWQDRHPPVKWGIWRNIPFLLLGLIVSVFYFINKELAIGLNWMWFAIIFSFACYMPVVLWSNKNPKIGMLMLPKSCAYLWILTMCLSL